jgi:DNA-directed RNA polymerase specialized sigma24 family protein
MGLYAVAGEERPRAPIEGALRENAALLGRVCMALVGDREVAERALERVAREAGSKPIPDGADAKVWLLGLARVACATQLSKIPVRAPSSGDASPNTARLGAAEDAAIARDKLAKLKPTEREAIVLTLVGGLDAAQVAAACGVDVATARARIARGMSQLVEEGS